MPIEKIYVEHFFQNTLSPEKIKEIKRDARRKYTCAINKGVLVRPDKCEICGKTGRIEGHHWHWYENPLDILWLCPQCHSYHDNCVSENYEKRYTKVVLIHY